MQQLQQVFEKHTVSLCHCDCAHHRTLRQRAKSDLNQMHKSQVPSLRLDLGLVLVRLWVAAWLDLSVHAWLAASQVGHGATLKANQQSVTFDLPFSLPMTNLREVKSLLPYNISLKSDPANKAPKYPNMQIPHSHCSAFNYKQLQAPRDHHGLNYFGDASSAWPVHSYSYYLIIWFLVAQIKTPCLGVEPWINNQLSINAQSHTSHK